MSSLPEDVLFQQAYDLSRQGRDDEARKTLSQLLSQWPNHVEGLVLMGYLSPPAAARTYFERALELDPYHVQAQRGLLKLESSQQRRLMGMLVIILPLVVASIGLFILFGISLFDDLTDEDNPTPTFEGRIGSLTPTISATPSPQPSPTPSSTRQPGPVLTSTPLVTLAATPLQFVPRSATPSPAVVVQDVTATSTMTNTSAPQPTATVTATPSITLTATATEDPNETWTPVPTATEDPNQTWTPTPTVTLTPTPTLTLTLTPTATEDPNQTWTPTPTATHTLTPTVTLTATPTETEDPNQT
ncbi:MAG: tetratricopeptide repeat protein [Chloroflexi bacterium]|nr:tetratricopeptide repeat protein [Chloroflexota bacterium]